MIFPGAETLKAVPSQSCGSFPLKLFELCEGRDSVWIAHLCVSRTQHRDWKTAGVQ